MEEAIIDATALKEAALKSAQASILEKYAPDVKKAIQVILEQEVLPTDTGNDDPLAGLESDTLPSLDDAGKGKGSAGDDGAGLTMPMPEEGPDPSNAVKKLPLAATESEKLCACPDEDEEVEINFDELERQMAATEPDDNVPDGMPQESPEQINLKMNEEIEIDEALLQGLFENSDEELEEGCDEEIEESLQEVDEPHRPDADDQQITTGVNQIDKDGHGQVIGRLSKRDIDDHNKKVQAQKQSQLKENRIFSENNILINEKKQLLTAKQELLQENKKLKNVVQDFTKRLTDLNLSNAKLLYTNKALISNSLNERQKIKIVEAISKAESVEEVNVVFRTLQQTVGSGNKKPEPKSLSEVVGNKEGLQFTRSKETKATQSNPVYDRMQKIAGISKKK